MFIIPGKGRKSCPSKIQVQNSTGDQDWSSTWALKGIQNVMLNFLVMRITMIYHLKLLPAMFLMQWAPGLNLGLCSLENGWFKDEIVVVLEAFWWTNIADWNPWTVLEDLLYVYWKLWDFPPVSHDCLHGAYQWNFYPWVWSHPVVPMLEYICYLWYNRERFAKIPLKSWGLGLKTSPEVIKK